MGRRRGGRLRKENAALCTQKGQCENFPQCLQEVNELSFVAWRILGSWVLLLQVSYLEEESEEEGDSDPEAKKKKKKRKKRISSDEEFYDDAQLAEEEELEQQETGQ